MIVRIRARVGGDTLAALAATSLLLVAAALGWTAALRVPLSSYVFLVVPGTLVVDSRWQLVPALRWALVLGGSAAIDIVLAEALLSLRLFSVTHFLGVLLLLVVAVLLLRLTRGGAGQPVVEVEG